jgi:hypothetical protein
MEANPVRLRSLLSWIGCLLALAGCPVDSSSLANSLKAECVPEGAAPPDGAWVCPEAKTIECDAALAGQVHTLYVQESEGLSCDDQALGLTTASQALAVGTHTITVANAEGEALCSAELTVEDTSAPKIAGQTIALWPPNHKFHRIAVEDCVQVSDACDSDLTAEFIWASSDEPVDSIGDGHHAPDIQWGDCQHLSVRSERQGPENGRVYKLGVRVVDGSGNATEGVCSVVVAHDQSGAAKAKANGKASGKASDKASGKATEQQPLAGEEAYRLVFDGSDGNVSCDGRPDEGEDDAPDVDAGSGDDVDAGSGEDEAAEVIDGEEDSVPVPG